MPDQKIDNLLNLAMDATPQERRKSENLNIGYDPATRLWDVIIKYSGPESGLAGKAGNGRHGGTCLRIGARYLPDQRKRKIYGERRQRLRFVGGRAFVGRSRRRGGFRGAGKQEEKIRHGKKTIEIFGGRGERPVIRRNVFRLSVRGFFRFGRQKNKFGRLSVL